MIKLSLPDDIKDSGLAIPESTPRTLVQIDGESLPYACQCPCCGSLFNIPEGLLYKVEEDVLLDGDFGAEPEEKGGPDIDIDVGGPGESSDSGSTVSSTTTTTSESGVGESDDSII